MYNHISAVFSNASNAHGWESCDCERNVKEDRVFHLDSFSVPGGGDGYLSATYKYIGPGYHNESVPALRAAVQVLLQLVWTIQADVWKVSPATSHRARVARVR